MSVAYNNWQMQRQYLEIESANVDDEYSRPSLRVLSKEELAESGTQKQKPLLNLTTLCIILVQICTILMALAYFM